MSHSYGIRLHLQSGSVHRLIRLTYQVVGGRAPVRQAPIYMESYIRLSARRRRVYANNRIYS